MPSAKTTRPAVGPIAAAKAPAISLTRSNECADATPWPDADAAAPEQARICLQFTSPTKPALITGSAGGGDDAAPDYRYLVVPLRALASA